ncbi:hypothetical protein M8J75_002334 [Diaphorina citri]|nr:hypothetical protein M8J75_002334 [Diaphorina citri]
MPCEGADVLSAFVMIDGKEEKIDSFCGNKLPRPLMSNGPRLVLEFKGIYSSRFSRGFQAVYTFTENFGINTGHQLSELPCAFMFNSTGGHRNGTFTSPNFPGLYPRDTECHYFFYGRNDERIKLVFESFDVEGVPPCEARTASDYIEFSNYMARDRKFPRYCGYISPFEVTSDQKFFRLTFRSNDRLDGTGFNASYYFIEETNTMSSSMKPTLSSTSSSNSVSVSILLSISLLCLVILLPHADL